MHRRVDLDRLPTSVEHGCAVAAAPTARPLPPNLILREIRARTLDRGINLPLYLLVRAILVPFFLVYFRLQRIGREHLPRTGPLLLAANHRSFLDPFVIGALSRRPVYYVAKRELFEQRWQAWLLNASAPSRSTAAPATRRRWTPRARSSSAATAS